MRYFTVHSGGIVVSITTAVAMHMLVNSEGVVYARNPYGEWYRMHLSFEDAPMWFIDSFENQLYDGKVTK